MYDYYECHLCGGLINKIDKIIRKNIVVSAITKEISREKGEKTPICTKCWQGFVEGVLNGTNGNDRHRRLTFIK